MKRVGNLFEQIVNFDNLALADEIARKGKKNRYGIELHDKNRIENLRNLYKDLKEGKYRTSEYEIFKLITDNDKERMIYRLPYYPDRICHHAIMNVLEPFFVNTFIRDTYSCLKGRGIHDGVRRIKKALEYKKETVYCLKTDIKKFYPSVDHEMLKSLLRRKFKDNRLLNLLDEIIDSVPGLPIGNYLSQYLSNFYLSYFDHWIKETLRIKHYFRYADDMVFLHSEKEELHELRRKIDAYFTNDLKLKMKDNWQVFPVESRGIDFLGYVFFHDHIRLRKRIKKNFARKITKHPGDEKIIASYKGWCKHGNCINLFKNLTGMKLFKELGVKIDSMPMLGEKIRINRIVNKEIEVTDYEINKSKYEEKSGPEYLKLQIKYEDEVRVVFTGASMLIKTIKKIEKAQLPFKTIIIEQNGFYQFT